VEEFEQIVEEIKVRMGDKIPVEGMFEYHNTICKNVANRVKRLQDFARSNDIVIFVGGQKSSNAKVLFNNCLEVNPCTIFVSSTADITPEILQQCHQAERVGICGATSTPKWLMENVKQHIQNNGI
jgi:4-hydroxy-3-methylbut-2-enyl diphosphate reductase